MLSQYLSNEHKCCDEQFAIMEQCVAEGNWSEATDAYKRFMVEMHHHLSTEEDILFPAFEQASGMAQGPTMVMRQEHEQFRQLFSEMEEAIAGKQQQDFLGASETLLIMMQQHNAKEEQILYPMVDRVLGQHAESLLESIKAG